MRPQLALGPIDSVTQYLVYLSVVVFGILLPLAIQRWIKRRHERQLLAATRSALREEIAHNRTKVLKSRDSFAALAALLETEIAGYRTLWQASPDGPEPARPAPTEAPVTVATPLRTAWDIATLRQALPLLPAPSLEAYAKAYQLQAALEQHRGQFLAAATHHQALEAPADLRQRPAIERRIEALLALQAISRQHAEFTQSLALAYDEALRRDA